MPDVDTPEQSTEELIKSLGWTFDADEQAFADGIDEDRDADVELVDDSAPEEKEGVETPESTDKVETPETPADAVLETPKAPEVPKESELDRYKREQETIQAAAKRDRDVATQIAGMAKQYMDRLVGEGWQPAAAQDMATRSGESAWAQYEAYKAKEELAQAQLSRLDQDLGAQYGVDPALLSNFKDREGKEAAAKTLGAAMSEAKKATEAVKNAVPKAPVQHQDSGTGTPGATNNTEQKKRDYSTGKINLSRSEFKDLYGYWP